MKSPEEYKRQLLKISAEHDTLENASSISEAKDNIIQLQKIESDLLFIELKIIAIMDDLRLLRQEKESNSLSLLFRKSKHEKELANIEDKLQLYGFELTHANAIRSVAGQVTVPKLEEYIRQKDQKSGKKINYSEYIKSQEWKQKAEEAKALAGNRCQVCNRSRAEVQLDAHHRTYERLGNEKPEDITVLCRECHQLYEDEKKENKSKKRCKRCKKAFVPPKASHLYCSECFSIIKQQKNAKPSKNGDKKSTSTKGVCIRCQKETKLNPQAPYCYTCFKSWNKYKNKKYEEKFCHICGQENNSSMLKPVCRNCYKKYRNQLEFQ